VFPIPAIPKPVFRYSELNFAGITGIRAYKMGTFDQNYYFLKFSLVLLANLLL
jgi:hypothetical protein